MNDSTLPKVTNTQSVLTPTTSSQKFFVRLSAATKRCAGWR